MDSLAGVLDGAAFVLQSALALAATVAAALAMGRVAARQAVAAALAFTVVAALTAWLPPLRPNVVAPAVLLVLGVLVASGWHAPQPVRWAAAIVGAVAAGVAGGLQTSTVEEGAGAAVVLLVLTLVLLVPAAVVRAGPRIERALGLARRMAGAWIAAVGALLLVLALR